MRVCVVLTTLAFSLASFELAAIDAENGTSGPWSRHSGTDTGPLPGELEGQRTPPGASIEGTISNPDWVNALGFEFRGRTSDYDFTSSTALGSQWCEAGSVERFADVRLDLPNNRQLTFFRMWGFDSSSTNNLAVFLFESCLPNLGAGEPVNTALAQLESSGTPGEFTETLSLALPRPVTDTRSCTYWARVRFATGCSGGSQLLLRKVRVQHSPAPATTR